MKKKQFQKKNIKIYPLSEIEALKAKTALINAVIQNLGYNPEFDYGIDESLTHKDLKDIKLNLLNLQEETIFISETLQHELLSCKKYIYKVEKKLIINNKVKEENRNGQIKRLIFHMIGKVDNNYIPFQLIINAHFKKNENCEFINLKETNCESLSTSFSTLLKGKDFFILDRIDNNNLIHLNKYFNKEKEVFESDPYNRKIIGAHKHNYSEEVMLHTFARIMQHNNDSSNMNYRILREMDAKKQDIMSFSEILNSYISNIHATYFCNFDENLALRTIYDECELKEKNLYKLTGTKDAITNNLINQSITHNNLLKLKLEDDVCYDNEFLHITREN